MLRRFPLISLSLLSVVALSANATNLWQIYQQAEQHDATYQAAAQTYKAAKDNLGIAFAALLPSVQLTANSTYNGIKGGAPSRYNSNGYQLQVTQQIFDLSAWAGYDQTRYKVAQAAVTYEQAKQALIMNTAKAYFAVLEAADKLRYAKQNQEQLQQQLAQTQEQYKVGLKAFTDVQSTKASYESAIASAVSAKNDLQNALEKLAVITGRPESHLTPLKKDLPLLKPDPLKQQAWVAAALKGNLAYQAAQLQARFDKAGITVARFGDNVAGIPGYLPTVQGVATYGRSRTHGAVPGSTLSGSLALNASYTVFNGFSTVYNVSKAKYTAKSSDYSEAQQRRDTVSTTRQNYLTILSDISQVQALHQAVVSNESSLKAIKAAYQVGTRTIVDLLTQQSNLFDTQQQYAEARYNYITDSLQLKATTGILQPKDLKAINGWLV